MRRELTIPNYKIKSSFFIILPFLLFTLVNCSGDSKNNGRNNRLIPAVEAVKADFGSLPLVERLSGVVKAKNQVDIYPEVTAVVQTVHVHNSDFVKKGDPLVSLRNIDYQERYNQAKASLQIAEAQYRQADARFQEVSSRYQRAEKLYEKGLSSDLEFDELKSEMLSSEADVALAKARVDQAKATLAEENENLSRTIIRAPISGVVGNRNAEIGMKTNSSIRLFTIGQLDTVRIEVVLTDRMLQYIDTGQRTEILSNSFPVGSMTSTLTRISPFLHPVTHSTEAEIEIANDNNYLKSGMFTSVDIFYGESEKATIVPLSALYENPITGETGVYIATDSLDKIPQNLDELPSNSRLTEPLIFDFIPVQVLAKGRMNAGILGIDPDSWVVTLGQDLFGGEEGEAKMRPVKWSWVEHLQSLQREDLLDEIIHKEPSPQNDTIVPGT